MCTLFFLTCAYYHIYMCVYTPGLAFRVPVTDVSVLDLTVKLKTPTTLDDILYEVARAGMIMCV